MNRGFIGFIAIFIILILIASAFKVNLRGYLDASPEEALDSNVVLVIQMVKVVWTDYIKGPILFIWNNYVLPFLRGDFLQGLRDRVESRTQLQ